MGWCHEFGVVVASGCSAPMVAGATSCACPECGTECHGRFASCTDVWAAGPRPVAVRRPESAAAPAQPAAALVASLVGGEGPAPSAAATGEVLAWMVGAVDDLRAEVQQVNEAVAAQQATVDRLVAAVAAGGAPAAAGEREPLLVAELRSWTTGAAERDRDLARALADLPARVAAEVAGRDPGVARALADLPARVAAEVAARDGSAATARVVALAEQLPNRLGAAIAAAVEGRQEAYLARVEEVTAALGSALAGVRAACADLRVEVDRAGRAGADGVDGVVDRLGRGLDHLADAVDRSGTGAPGPV
ncbi:MAG TPA: hypothetical protein VGB14_07540 [Acidimicrobiales bacterium]|jgi:hypothetical protein